MQARYRSASLVLALSSLCATAQTTSHAVPPPLPPLVGSIAGHPGWPVAKPEDVKSPEAILNAVYDVISGGKGQARDWNRMRSLFLPGARLIPVITVAATADKPAPTDAVLLTIDDYIARSSGRMTANGFFEHSIHNEKEQFGNMVQIWSTYESRHNADDPKPFARGINSFQLLNDGKRYWIVNI
ncbi:MAG TPA: hypothetical protein VE195_00495, partial [Acidobacteriaceae bacterium]|nr:hypothetical protein [Acidobacteriaceae bacterium]